MFLSRWKREKMSQKYSRCRAKSFFLTFSHQKGSESLFKIVEGRLNLRSQRATMACFGNNWPSGRMYHFGKWDRCWPYSGWRISDGQEGCQSRKSSLLLFQSRWSSQRDLDDQDLKIYQWKPWSMLICSCKPSLPLFRLFRKWVASIVWSRISKGMTTCVRQHCVQRGRSLQSSWLRLDPWILPLLRQMGTRRKQWRVDPSTTLGRGIQDARRCQPGRETKPQR